MTPSLPLRTGLMQFSRGFGRLAGIVLAFATLSGGNYGSGVISGTKLATSGKSYTVTMWFDEQGTNPNLNLKFYLYHS